MQWGGGAVRRHISTKYVARLHGAWGRVFFLPVCGRFRLAGRFPRIVPKGGALVGRSTDPPTLRIAQVVVSMNADARMRVGRQRGRGGIGPPPSTMAPHDQKEGIGGGAAKPVAIRYPRATACRRACAKRPGLAIPISGPLLAAGAQEQGGRSARATQARRMHATCTTRAEGMYKACPKCLQPKRGSVRRSTDEPRGLQAQCGAGREEGVTRCRGGSRPTPGRTTTDWRARPLG